MKHDRNQQRDDDDDDDDVGGTVSLIDLEKDALRLRKKKMDERRRHAAMTDACSGEESMSLNSTQAEGDEMFLLSCIVSYMDGIKEGIQRGIDLNKLYWIIVPDDRSQSCYTSPMHIAAEQGQSKILDLLIANKARVDIRDLSGATPLHRYISSA
eukprot:608847-Hanusia_phi.AAC.5